MSEHKSKRAGLAFAGPAYPIQHFPPAPNKRIVTLVITDRTQLFMGSYDDYDAVGRYLSHKARIARPANNYSGPGFYWSFVLIDETGQLIDETHNRPLNRADQSTETPLVQFWGNVHIVKPFNVVPGKPMTIEYTDPGIEEEFDHLAALLADGLPPQDHYSCKVCGVYFPAHLMLDHGQYCQHCYEIIAE